MTSLARARPWAGRLEPLWWAARALGTEILGFRFRYPVEVVSAAAGAGALPYHIRSERLFFDVMELDDAGVPRQRSRVFGTTYNPAYVAWYGLTSLTRSALDGDAGGGKAFAAQVDWLRRTAVRREDGAVVWPYRFDWREGACQLRAPWISSMAQGLAISALVRAHRLTPDPELLALARGATLVFDKAIADGGVRTLEHGHALYEEYPGYPLPRILDGFLFSLLGLYDLALELPEERIRTLFEDGIAGLRSVLPFWDYRGKWSWYGAHGYLCPPKYNALNAALLSVLAGLTHDPDLARRARAWDPPARSLADRVELYLAFVVLKNAARLRYRVA